MPVKNSDSEPFPAEYVRARLREVQEAYGLTIVQMAKIAGYERAALHRVLKDGVPSIFALHRLSMHLGLPMTYWFPPDDGVEPMKLPSAPDCTCAGQAPLTREIVQAIGRLGAVEKDQLLKLVKSDALTLEQLVQLTTIAASVHHTKKERFFKLAGMLAERVKKEPAPP